MAVHLCEFVWTRGLDRGHLRLAAAKALLRYVYWGGGRGGVSVDQGTSPWATASGDWLPPERHPGGSLLLALLVSFYAKQDVEEADAM